MFKHKKRMEQDLAELQTKVDLYSNDLLELHKQFDENYNNLQNAIQDLVNQVSTIESNLNSLKKDYNSIKYNVVFKKKKK